MTASSVDRHARLEDRVATLKRSHTEALAKARTAAKAHEDAAAAAASALDAWRLAETARRQAESARDDLTDAAARVEAELAAMSRRLEMGRLVRSSRA